LVRSLIRRHSRPPLPECAGSAGLRRGGHRPGGVSVSVGQQLGCWVSDQPSRRAEVRTPRVSNYSGYVGCHFALGCKAGTPGRPKRSTESDFDSGGHSIANMPDGVSAAS
jgi:hypothetical protein